MHIPKLFGRQTEIPGILSHGMIQVLYETEISPEILYIQPATEWEQVDFFVLFFNSKRTYSRTIVIQKPLYFSISN